MGIQAPTIDYARYVTGPDQYSSWVDSLFARVPLPTPLAAPLLSLFVFVVGLAVAVGTGLTRGYLRTPALYIGLVGIAWTLATIRGESRRLHLAFEDLRPIFLVDDAEYLSTIDRWFKRYGNLRKDVVFVLTLFALFMVGLYVAMYRDDLIRHWNIRSLRPRAFPAFWYQAHMRAWKTAIIGWYWLCIAAALGTAMRLMLVSLLFMLDLRRFPVVPLASIIRMRLRRVTNLYVYAAGSMLIGIPLFVGLYYPHFDAYSIPILAGLFILASLTFAVPQMAFRSYLLRSHAAVCSYGLQSFYKIIGVELIERDDVGDPSSMVSYLGTLANIPLIVAATSQPAVWVYAPKDVLLLLVSQLLGIAGGTIVALLVR